MIDEFQNNENLEMFNYYNKTLKKKVLSFQKRESSQNSSVRSKLKNSLTNSNFAQSYQKALDGFIKEAKTLPNIYGPKQLRHDNYESDAYVDNYSVELDIHSENMDGYIYPSIELVTHTSIKK